MATQRVKYALRSFAYNFIDIEDKHFHKDSKRVKIMKNLKNRFVILKPDKGQGVVLLKKYDVDGKSVLRQKQVQASERR